MLQPGRLQRMVEPVKLKKDVECPVYNRLEIRGNTGKQAEQTGKNGRWRQNPEGSGNNRKNRPNLLVRDQNAVGERAERQHSVLSAAGGREANESIETSNATAPREQCED